MPAIDLSVLCIPAECDNIKNPYNGEIASLWDAYLLCDICRHFASVMLHFASLHYIFSAYLPTHIKFITEFRCIFFRTTCISFPKFEVTSIGAATSCYIAVKTIKGSTINWHCLIIFIRGFDFSFYPTFTPGFTSPWGPMTTRRPSASSALRIMPWLSMPLSLRGGKLAMKHTSLPIKSAGS